jgi:penicillin-binding protein 2
MKFIGRDDFMKIAGRVFIWSLFGVFVLTIASCESPTVIPSEIFRTETPTASVTPPLTVTPSDIPPTKTPIPDPEDTTRTYLEAWKIDDYSTMYDLLTMVSKDAISKDELSERYREFMSEAAVSTVEYEILSSFSRNSESVEVSYRITLDSVLVGKIQRDTVMNLSLESGGWRVQWADELILPELAGGNYLWMNRQIPSRANIYDRNGDAITAFAEAVSVAIIPGQFEPGTEEDMLSDLQLITGMHPDSIYYKYYDQPVGAEWLVYLGEVPLANVAKYYDVTNGYNFNGLLMYPYESRFYFNNGIAPQTIGYVSFIQAEEEEEYLRKGYSRDEKIGRQGIEKWGDPYLGGTRGGSLYVIGPDDQVVTLLADVPAKPAQAIYTTLDSGLQLAAQSMIQKFYGAVVALEVDTGRVLAMASSPHFDPNAFEPANANSRYQIEDIYDPYGGLPLYNRPTQGQYALGSVFKIVTMAAAMESGLYQSNTTYDCGYDFVEIPEISPRHDWTWDHCQDEIAADGECRTRPSGTLTLVEGLMRSCNPYFWHIGLDLYRQGLTEAISDMAHGFGLGSPTGIEGVPEEDGNIPSPGDEVEAINLAIGQGDTLVTPLQVAQFIAAIANGGTIYQPQLIQRITPPDGDPTFEFEPIIKGELPISPVTLDAIQRGMRAVVENSRGTAAWVLSNYSQNLYAMSGKTGTAELGFGDSHAWFAGYSRENRENKSDIAIVVIAENAGEGSDIAAPIFRGMVQYYFEGRRSYILPWESYVGVLELPEEPVVEEPAQ